MIIFWSTQFNLFIRLYFFNHTNRLKIHTDCDVELHWMQAHLSKYERNREQRHLDIDESFSVPTVIRPLWRWHPPVQQQYQISEKESKKYYFYCNKILPLYDNLILCNTFWEFKSELHNWFIIRIINELSKLINSKYNISLN